MLYASSRADGAAASKTTMQAAAICVGRRLSRVGLKKLAR
jgi:hypothetical protein